MCQITMLCSEEGMCMVVLDLWMDLAGSCMHQTLACRCKPCIHTCRFNGSAGMHVSGLAQPFHCWVHCSSLTWLGAIAPWASCAFEACVERIKK